MIASIRAFIIQVVPQIELLLSATSVSLCLCVVLLRNQPQRHREDAYFSVNCQRFLACRRKLKRSDARGRVVATCVVTTAGACPKSQPRVSHFPACAPGSG